MQLFRKILHKTQNKGLFFVLVLGLKQRTIIVESNPSGLLDSEAVSDISTNGDIAQLVEQFLCKE